MAKLKVNGVEIDYADQGSGAPLVLVHGFGGSRFSWDVIIPQLSKDYRVITSTLRGMGGTDRPADGNYSRQAMADDIHVLLKELAVENPVILGHSMGGHIAQTYYFEYPKDVKALVLYGTLSDTTRSLPSGPTIEQAAHVIKTKGMQAILEEFMIGWLTPEASPELKDQVRMMALSTPNEVASALRKEIPTFIVSSRLHEIQVPTLAITGSDDPRTTVEGHERLNRDIPDCWLKIIKGTRHYVHLEKPEEFIQALLAFLRAVG